MSTPAPQTEPLAPGLGDLTRRLGSGLLPGARDLLPSDPHRPSLTWEDLTPRLRALWNATAESLSAPPSRKREVTELVEEAITEFGRYLATPDERVRRQLRTLVLYPEELATRAATVEVGEPGDERAPWVRLCHTVEAVWRGLSATADPHSDLGRLLPVAARTRFLVLTEPMRHRARALTPRIPLPRGGLTPKRLAPRNAQVWRATRGEAYEGHTYGSLDRAFGPDSRSLLLTRARAARRDWYAYLDTYQAHPLLAQASPAALEAEVAALATARGYPSGPLVLTVEPTLEHPARPDGQDDAITWGVVRRHLLPRFAVLRSVALLDTTVLGLGRLLAVLPLLCGLAAPTALALGHSFTVAALFAAGCYSLIALGALCFGRLWAAPWLLRLPATAAMGLVVLVPLPDWWQRARLDLPVPTLPQIAPILLLVGISLGYLLIEVRNHGVGRRPALPRAVTVAAAGAGHAFLVSLLGLVVIAPAFGEHTDGTGIDAVWNGATGDPAAVLALATAWCLTVGVFSQILWDDRPITAPLAHLSWQNDH